eukprot:jgi/Tetstr1/422237/TSEL_013089.t1
MQQAAPLPRGAARVRLVAAPADGVAPAVLLEVDGGQACPHSPLRTMGGALLVAMNLSEPTVGAFAHVHGETKASGGSCRSAAPLRFQYLFGAPEGFSRLVLEHKVRPSGKLRTLFAGDICSRALGGLGGLLLRLASDGHGQLELVGPRGAAQAVHALRHVIRWRHPALYVSEWDGWCPPVLFQDDKVSVAAVWSGGGGGVTWQAPAWLEQQPALGAGGAQEGGDAGEGQGGRLRDGRWRCRLLDSIFKAGGAAGRSRAMALLRGGGPPSYVPEGPQAGASTVEDATETRPPAARSISTESSALSSSSEAADSTSSGDSSSGDSDSDSSSEGGSGSDPGRDGHSGGGRCGAEGKLGAKGREAAFEQMDALFGSPGMRRGDALRLMSSVGGVSGPPKAGKAKVAPRKTAIAVPPQAKSQQVALKHKVTPSAAAATTAPPPEGQMPADRWSSAATEARRQSAVQCEPGGNPVYAYSSTWAQPQRHKAGDAREGSTKASVLLYICHVPANDGVVAIVNCASLRCLRHLARHPALDLLRAQPRGRLAAVFHLAEPRVAGTREYRRWAERLPGQQVMHWHAPGTCKHEGGSTEALAMGIGHSASARTLARLNVISWALFPLPEPLMHVDERASKEQAEAAAEGKRSNQPAKRGRRNLVEAQLLLRVDSAPLAHAGSAVSPAWLPPDDGDCPTDERLLQAVGGHHALQEAAPVIRELRQACSALGIACNEGRCRWKPTALPPPGAGVVPPWQPIPPPPPQPTPLQPPAATAPASNRDAASRLRAALMTAAKPDNGESDGPAKESDFAPGSLSEELMSQLSDAPQCLRALQRGGQLAEVAFLGTGSAEPSKYRGPSAIHLRLPAASLLLDCGENTIGQLRRAHGSAGAAAEVAALAAVWISHKHADHCLGLPALLSARPPSCGPLLVVGPWAVKQWLQEVASHMGLSYAFAHCAEFNNALHPQRSPVMARLGLERWLSVPVQHCRDAWGLVLQAACGWKIVYSGDTRPCLALQRAGRGATLLIHEATFEPGLADQACRKRHSTTEEALEAAAKMGAYRTVLTHFSQRYPGLPQGLPLDDPILGRRPAVAFDGMRIPLASLPELPLLMPLLAAVMEYRPEAAPGGDADAADSAAAGEETGDVEDMAPE